MGHWGCRSIVVEGLCCGKATPDKNISGNTATEMKKVCNVAESFSYTDPREPSARYEFKCDFRASATHLFIGSLTATLGVASMLA